MDHEKTTRAGPDEVLIDPSQLSIGLFVRLNLGWVDHPFLFNQFRITKTSQIAEIQALGLAKVRCVPSRSTSKPLPPSETKAHSESTPRPSAPKAGAGAAATEVTDSTGATGDASAIETSASETSTSGDPPDTKAVPAAISAKAAHAKRIAEQRARIVECEQRYTHAASDVRKLMHNLHADSDKSVASARHVVGNIVDSFTESGEIVIHLMNEKLAEETSYFHVLNVMILSLLLGRELKLPPELLCVLGEGALFHDIGKTRVPDSVLRNSARNRHEEEFYRLHTVYGREIARELGSLSKPVSEIIEFHHETADGKGYPSGLAGQKIPVLARIVAITNRYDNLCNPLPGVEALTPATAVAKMFRDEANAWDATMLKHFIRLLGVYPPGSLVQLSNGNVGLVISVNHSDLLRPSVMIFDPDTPKDKAIVVDLKDDPDVTIDFVMKPGDLDKAAQTYLSPRRRMTYFHGKHS